MVCFLTVEFIIIHVNCVIGYPFLHYLDLGSNVV
jgi:hypothetical protein